MSLLTLSNPSCLLMYFVTKVGIKARNPKNSKVSMLFIFMPMVSISLRVKPVWIKIKLFGIRPTLSSLYRRMLHQESKYKAFPLKEKPNLQTNLEWEESISRRACTKANSACGHWPYCEILQIAQETFWEQMTLPKNSWENSIDWLPSKSNRVLECTLQ